MARFSAGCAGCVSQTNEQKMALVFMLEVFLCMQVTDIVNKSGGKSGE